MSDPRQKLLTTWKRVLSSMRAFGKGVEARPSQGDDIFKRVIPNPSGVVRFEVSPVVFKLPERPNHAGPNMFVVVSGFLEFPTPDAEKEDRTCGFGTRVAYFRDGPKRIDHTCGIHYDFEAKLIAHPVFHAQFAPLAFMSDHVRNMRRDNWEDGDDCMKGVISTVRLPTAQMDFFAVALQLCADHLVNCDSDQRTKERFYDLRAHVAQSMAGACNDHPGLRESIRKECLRGPHWYLPNDSAFRSGSGASASRTGRTSPASCSAG